MMSLDEELQAFAERVAASSADPSAKARLGTYKAQGGGFYQCPVCWANGDLLSPLRKETPTSLRCGASKRSFFLTGSS